jgi:hypothetical protein
MPDDLITLDDVPSAEIALVRGFGPSIRNPEVYDTLKFISQLAPGRAARITGVTAVRFRDQLYGVCKTRWPGTRVCRYGDIIDVSRPQNGDA